MTISGWALRKIVEPALEPVTLEEAKLQCQVDADIIDQDSRISSYIKAGREEAEAYIKGSIMEQTWRLTGATFPCEYIELPNGPIIQIESVKYYDTDGVQQTLAVDVGYQPFLDDEPPRLYPPVNGAWPAVQARQGAIDIQYTAGYRSTGSPAGADAVPASIKEAILAYVATRYHQREDEIFGTIHSQNTFGFERTLDKYRRYP